MTDLKAAFEAYKAARGSLWPGKEARAWDALAAAIDKALVPPMPSVPALVQPGQVWPVAGDPRGPVTVEHVGDDVVVYRWANGQPGRRSMERFKDLVGLP